VGDVIAGLIKECNRGGYLDILDDELQNHRNNVQKYNDNGDN
jgi:hypothetical protein